MAKLNTPIGWGRKQPMPSGKTEKTKKPGIARLYELTDQNDQMMVMLAVPLLLKKVARAAISALLPVLAAARVAPV
jgi:hypothetical protein